MDKPQTQTDLAQGMSCSWFAPGPLGYGMFAVEFHLEFRAVFHALVVPAPALNLCWGGHTELPFPPLGGRWEVVCAAIPAPRLLPKGWLSILTRAGGWRIHFQGFFPTSTAPLRQDGKIRPGCCGMGRSGGEGRELGVESLQISRRKGQSRGERS